MSGVFDVILPLKYEYPGLGTEIDEIPAETDPSEDYVGAAGLDIGANKTHYIDINNNEIAFTDPENGTTMFSELLARLTASAHKSLYQLVHSIARDSHYDITYDGTYTWRVSSEVWWTDNGKTQKIREIIYTYDVTDVWKINTEEYKQYDSSGTLIETLTGTYIYSGVYVDYIDWVLT